VYQKTPCILYVSDRIWETLKSLEPFAIGLSVEREEELQEFEEGLSRQFENLHIGLLKPLRPDLNSQVTNNNSVQTHRANKKKKPSKK
jgi:hypothetical protein